MHWTRRASPWVAALALASCAGGGAASLAVSIDSGAAGAFAPLEGAACAEGKRYYRGARKLGIQADESLDSVELRVAGSRVARASSPPLVLDWDTRRSGDGDVLLVVVGTTTNGTPVERRFQVCVDNEPPKLAADLQGPLSVRLEDARLEFAVEALDPYGVRYIRAVLAAANVPPLSVSCGENKSAAVCRLAPDTLAKTLQPGEVDSTATLTVSAEDRAGNLAQLPFKVELSTRLRWTFDTGGRVVFGIAALPDGRVAVGANDATDPTRGHRVFVLSSQGQELCEWDPQLVGGEAITAPLVASQDKVFFTTMSSLVALAPSTAPTGTPAACAPAWAPQKAHISFSYSRVAVDEGRRLLYVIDQGSGGTKAALVAYDLDSGKLATAWSVTLSPHQQLGHVIYASPAVSADGHVYVGNEAGELFRAHYPDLPPASPGTLDPFYATGGPIRTAVLPTTASVLVTTADAFVRLVGPDGVSQLAYKAASPFSTDIILSPGGDWLYVGSTNGFLYSLSAKTLSYRARYNTGSMAGQPEEKETGSTVKPYGSPVVGPDGTVYAGCAFARNLEDKDKQSPCRLNALSEQSLELLWSFAATGVGNNLFLGSPALASGQLYIGSTKGVLYALDTAPVAH